MTVGVFTGSPCFWELVSTMGTTHLRGRARKRSRAEPKPRVLWCHFELRSLGDAAGANQAHERCLLIHSAPEAYITKELIICE